MLDCGRVEKFEPYAKKKSHFFFLPFKKRGDRNKIRVKKKKIMPVASTLGVKLEVVPALRAHVVPPPPSVEISYPAPQKVELKINRRVQMLAAACVLLTTAVNVVYVFRLEN